MFGLIIFLLLLVILWPLIRFVAMLFMAKRQVNRMRDGFFGSQAKGNAPAQPQPRKKKIPNDVGEYVEYEEVDEEIANHYTGTHTVYHEEQVVDVKWSDIPRDEDFGEDD